MTEARAAASPWRIVVALGITQIVSWGTLYYAIALLIDPLSAAVSATPATVVGAFSVALLVAGLLSSPMGALIDRHGGRAVMTFGSALCALLLMRLPYVHSVTELYLLWAGLGVAMAATLYDPAFAVLAQVFRERQRKAITMLTLFGGFASTVFWPLTQTLVARFGWQDAVLMLAVINLLVCVPLHALTLPAGASNPAPRAAKTVSRGALHAVLRDPSFYWLCAAFTGNSLVFSAMSIHLIGVLEGKGLSTADAAWVGALIGPMQVLGRILEFTFLSKANPSRVGILAMWLLPTSLGLLAFGNGHVVLGLFALLYGAGNGVITIVRGAIPVELYGAAHYGAVNGAMATPVLLAKAAGPIAASLAFAGAGIGSALVLTLALIAAAAAALFTLTVVRAPARRGVAAG